MWGLGLITYMDTEINPSQSEKHIRFRGAASCAFYGEESTHPYSVYITGNAVTVGACR